MLIDMLHDLDDEALIEKHLESHEAYHQSPDDNGARYHNAIVTEMLARNLDHPDHDELDQLEPKDPDDAEANVSTDPHSDSIMLAFFLPKELGQKLAIEGGEEPDDLHLTLAYLGHTDDWPAEQLDELPGLVSVYAANSQPLSGSISGMGRFAASPSSDSRDVLYHSVDLPDLPAWRQGLVDWLEDGGFPQKSEHGYTPHVTMKYLAPDETAEIGMLEQHPVKFGELVCKIGDQKYRFPLASRQSMRPQKWADRLMAQQETVHESHTSRSVFSPPVRRSAEADDPGYQLRDGSSGGEPVRALSVQPNAAGAITAGEAKPEIIYGILLVPGEPDLDGDVFPAEVISKACADYSNRLEADEQHRFANPQLEVADSFIAPEGYALDGHPVKSGSWIVGIRTADPEVIKKVKSGNYRGLSMEGNAVVRERR